MIRSGPRLCENPEFELPVENSCQYSLALAQLWSDSSIVSVILNLKCRSIPINSNLIGFSHSLGRTETIFLRIKMSVLENILEFSKADVLGTGQNLGFRPHPVFQGGMNDFRYL